MRFDLIVRGGRLAGPGGLIDADLAVRDGRVAALLGPGEGQGAVEERADGQVVLPGLIDLHTHLREPGQTWKEDAESGTAAAAAGGFTTVVAQPNTLPPADSPEALAAVAALVRPKAHVDIGLSALVTPANAGRLAELQAAGACCLDLVDPDRRTAEAALRSGLPACFYFADETVGAVLVAALAREVGVRAVLRQISRAATVEALSDVLREAVWIEVNPHHLILGPESGAQVLPPLRGPEDRAALWRRFDYVGTDHAPHTAEERAAGATGLPGLETALAVVLALGATWGEAVRWLSRTPAEIAGLFPRKGTLRPGADADLALVAPRTWLVDEARLLTRARYSPFKGWLFEHLVVATYVRGRCVYREGEVR